MKQIAYIRQTCSKCNGNWLPSDFSKTLRSSQQNDQRLGISSILSYKNHHYFQILERDDNSVDALCQRINNNNSVLVEHTVKAPVTWLTSTKPDPTS